MNWKILGSKYPFVCPWLKVRMDHVRMPSGVEIPDFYVTELPDWVNVIAITIDGKFIIEEQYRHGLQRVCFELCAGVVGKDEVPMDAARRELMEETGYGGGKWTAFGTYAPNASGTDNVSHAFLATGVELRQKQALDATEDIRVHLVDENELRTMMLDGRIAEAAMLAPLWRYFANGRQ